MASFIYPPNSTTPSPFFTQYPQIQDDLHWFYFTVNYLSICGGYVGGTEDPEYRLLECKIQTPGFRFRTDETFIVNFLSYDENFPINGTVPLETFSTGSSFATLIVGIVVSVFGVVCLVVEVVGGWEESGMWAMGSVSVLGVC